MTYDPIFRVALGFLIFLCTGIFIESQSIFIVLNHFYLLGLIQFLLVSVIYQRFFQDKILNFIDFCSVSNISVFILDQPCHGFYIHGRSPHGMTDVNMKELLMNFYREENSQCGTRGLQDNSPDQLFIMKINRSFYRQYKSLFENYNVSLVMSMISYVFTFSIDLELHQRETNSRR